MGRKHEGEASYYRVEDNPGCGEALKLVTQDESERVRERKIDGSTS